MPVTDYTRSSRKVINPYTFVPINNKNKNTWDAYQVYTEDVKLLTGVLHCSMYLKTPLAIPDTEKGKAEPVKGGKQDDVHMKYEFTKRGDRYVVGASSIRGVLRSTYETMTESCFATIKENTSLSGRVESTSVYSPGIIKKDKKGYVLYMAKRHKVMINDYAEQRRKNNNGFDMIIDKDKRMILGSDKTKLSTGDEVLFKSKGKKLEVFDLRKNDKKTAQQNATPGILFIGEYIEGKRYESVFEQTKEVKLNNQSLKQEALKTAYENWKATLKKYRDPAINRNLDGDEKKKIHSGYKGYEAINEEIGIPIWYNVEKNGSIHFSPAAIGRITYNNTLNKLVNKKNVCVDRSHLCEACLLFGMISKDGQSMGSRIRVSDAYSSNIPVSATPDYVTLKELGAPRNSYFPFYARIGNHRVPVSYDENSVEIAGRKFYWHNRRVNITKSYEAENLGGDEKTTRNSSMELLFPGADRKFTFDIYYDGITKEQKDKLIWAISLGENKWDSSMCHKIGHGKPLGLGSVKMVIDSDEERVYSENGYFLEQREVDIVDMPKTETIQNLKKVLDFDELLTTNKGVEIDYPDVLDKNDQPFKAQDKLNNNDIARHQWYTANKNEKDDKQKALPVISDADQTIAQYSYKKKTGNSQTAGGKNSQQGNNRNGNVKSKQNNKSSSYKNAGNKGGTKKKNDGNTFYNNNEKKNGYSDSNEGLDNRPFANLKLDNLELKKSNK